MRAIPTLALALLLCAPAPARQAPPSFGHDFVTIGAPGNRPALPSERPYSFLGWFPNLGQVKYQYRISRTETTVRQWFDFVNVAWPFAEAMGVSRLDSRFSGSHIGPQSLNPSAPPNYVMAPGWESVAVEISFRFATWYCNWLHNGRPTANVTLNTFTTGAYDLATMTRRPGALYWIPSLDEWTKATYYDPNRYGPGQEGYWTYPGKSDVPLVGGPPGSPGAQTSAGGWWSFPQHGPQPDVGSYPDIQSPWGLLDTSGGVSEMTDSPDWFMQPGRRLVRGANVDDFIGLADVIDYLAPFTSFDSSGHGFRMASAVPPPGAAFVLFGFSAATISRRRRP